MVVLFLVVEVAIAEAFVCQFLQFLLRWVEHTTAEVGEFLIVVLQTEHLSEFQCLDDSAPFVHPRLYKHINALRVTVLAGKHYLLAKAVIAKV